MAVALVLGGYVNGYSIIRELSECGVKNIWLFHYGSSLAAKSNRILGHKEIEITSDSLLENIKELRKQFEHIVIYPTEDRHLELLSLIHDHICSFCYVPINISNIATVLHKSFQYSACQQIAIPFPKSRLLMDEIDLLQIADLDYPLLIKPDKRLDLTTSVFRNLYIKNRIELRANTDLILAHLREGIPFLVSEFIPGDDTNIFAYAGYRSQNGKIQNEWIGKKLNQCPNDFGNFSSATNFAPEVVRKQGRRLVEHLDVKGFAQPEFKFDSRDNSYKLTEVNLRSMMWNRMGHLSGVHLHYTQWCDAVNKSHSIDKQDLTSRIHFLYMKHEIVNLLSRPDYWKNFLYNLTGGDRHEFAVFDKQDLRPVLYDLIGMPKALAKVWLMRLLKRPRLSKAAPSTNWPSRRQSVT